MLSDTSGNVLLASRVIVLISGLPCYGKPLRPFLTGGGLAYVWSFIELNSLHELCQVCLYELQISILLWKTIKMKQLVLGFVLVFD